VTSVGTERTSAALEDKPCVRFKLPFCQSLFTSPPRQISTELSRSVQLYRGSVNVLLRSTVVGRSPVITWTHTLHDPDVGRDRYGSTDRLTDDCSVSGLSLRLPVAEQRAKAASRADLVGRPRRTRVGHAVDATSRWAERRAVYAHRSNADPDRVNPRGTIESLPFRNRAASCFGGQRGRRARPAQSQ